MELVSKVDANLCCLGMLYIVVISIIKCHGLATNSKSLKFDRPEFTSSDLSLSSLESITYIIRLLKKTKSNNICQAPSILTYCGPYRK